MAQQSIEILRNYMTCEDPAVKNKYFNILDSFWHKSEGDLLLKITEDTDDIILQFTSGKTIAFSKPPSAVGISYVNGLQDELDKKVAKVPGKGLSENDFTNELLQKLNGLSNYTHPTSHPISMIDGLADALSEKVDKEAGKGLSSHDFTGLLKEKLEQQRETILISGNKFTYIPIMGNDGSSVVAGDIAKDGWIDQNTFGKLLSYKGTGDATLIENWNVIESI